MSASTSSGVAVAAAPRSSGVAVVVSPAQSHPTVGRHLRALGLHTINAVDPFLAARLVAGRHVELAMVEATTPAAIAAILVLARAARDSGHHTDIVALEVPDTATAAAALAGRRQPTCCRLRWGKWSWACGCATSSNGARSESIC